VMEDGEMLEHTLLHTSVTGRRDSSHCHWNESSWIEALG
jgi:hypothetical protein